MNLQTHGIGGKTLVLGVMILAASLMLTAQPVSAESKKGAYLSLSGAINIPENIDISNADTANGILTGVQAIDADAGLGFSHAVGFRFGRSLSAELEYVYQQMDFSKGITATSETTLGGEIDNKSFLFNVLYHFNTRGLTPFIGYGMGVALQTAALDGFGDAETSTFAYQVKMGVDIGFSKNLGFLLGYRYYATSHPDFGFFTGELTTHHLEAGIKYHF